MMIWLWSGIKRHFQSDSALSKSVRTLYLGHNAQRRKKTLPYVEVTCQSTNSINTFEKEIFTSQLVFTFFSDLSIEDKIIEGMQRFQEAFNDNIAIPFPYVILGEFELTATSGPSIDDGVYTGSLTYRVSYQKKYTNKAEPLVIT